VNGLELAGRHLSSRSKQWALDVNKLQPGDIIGTGDRSKRGDLIRAHTGGGPLSHVALYVGNDEIVEAVMPLGRRKGATDYILTNDRSSVVVLRVNPSFSNLAVDQVKAYEITEAAKIYVGGFYSVVKALAFKFIPFEILAARDGVICSELVVRAYSKGGIEICPQKPFHRISPNDIYFSPHLIDVGNECVREITAEEIGAIRSSRYGTLRLHLHDWLDALIWFIVFPARRARSTPIEQLTISNFLCLYLVREFRVIGTRYGALKIWTALTLLRTGLMKPSRVRRSLSYKSISQKTTLEHLLNVDMHQMDNAVVDLRNELELGRCRLNTLRFEPLAAAKTYNKKRHASRSDNEVMDLVRREIRWLKLLASQQSAMLALFESMRENKLLCWKFLVGPIKCPPTY
jgi:uncharacterized protein YycO